MEENYKVIYVDPFDTGTLEGAENEESIGVASKRVLPSSSSVKSQRRMLKPAAPPQPVKDRPFECKICFQRFVQKQTLKQHILTHTGQRPFPCDFCAKSFTQLSALQRHSALHFDQSKPFSCPLCPLTFRQANNLKRHVSLHGEAPARFQCEICTRSFTRKQSLERHAKKHLSTRDILYCMFCKLSFASAATLERHERNHREKENETQFTADGGLQRLTCVRCNLTREVRRSGKSNRACPNCDSYPFSGGDLITVKSEHTFDYVCKLCGESYPKQSHLEKHYLVHRKEVSDLSEFVRMFECHYCGLLVTCRTSIVSHLKTHELKILKKCVKVSDTERDLSKEHEDEEIVSHELRKVQEHFNDDVSFPGNEESKEHESNNDLISLDHQIVNRVTKEMNLDSLSIRNVESPVKEVFGPFIPVKVEPIHDSEQFTSQAESYVVYVDNEYEEVIRSIKTETLEDDCQSIQTDTLDDSRSIKTETLEDDCRSIKAEPLEDDKQSIISAFSLVTVAPSTMEFLDESENMFGVESEHPKEERDLDEFADEHVNKVGNLDGGTTDTPDVSATSPIDVVFQDGTPVGILYSDNQTIQIIQTHSKETEEKASGMNFGHTATEDIQFTNEDGIPVGVRYSANPIQMSPHDRDTASMNPVEDIDFTNDDEELRYSDVQSLKQDDNDPSDQETLVLSEVEEKDALFLLEERTTSAPNSPRDIDDEYALSEEFGDSTSGVKIGPEPNNILGRVLAGKLDSTSLALDSFKGFMCGFDSSKAVDSMLAQGAAEPKRVADSARTEDNVKYVEVDVDEDEFIFFHDADEEEGEGKPRLFFCYVCKKSYVSKHSVRRHFRLTHTNYEKAKCAVCAKTFQSKDALNKHVQAAHGPPRFHCALCPKTFSRKYGLDCHTRLHAADKPFACEQCGKCFAQKQNLYAHAKKHQPEAPYACNICDKRFYAKCTLKNHEKIHRDERNYQCEICDRTFIQKNNLDKHYGTHGLEEPGHRCDICGRVFAKESTLMRHVATHVSGAYYCHACAAGFEGKRSLQVHLKRWCGQRGNERCERS